MFVKYDYWEGHISSVLYQLQQSVCAYTQHYHKVKIGITCNPERRLSEHYRSKHEWDQMVIKYKTTSVKYINQIEKLLIDSNWNYVTNERGGGGGPNGEPPYYLYVLLKK